MNTDTPQIVCERVDILLDLNREEEALALLGVGLAHWPSDRDLQCRLASVLLKGSIDPTEGLAAAERACELDPDFEWAHRLRSWGLRRLDRKAEAEQASRTAVRCAPNSWHCHADLAWTLYSSKRYEEAQVAAEKARELAPQETEPHFILASLKYEMTQWADAEEHLLVLLELDPHHEKGLEKLYETQSNQGKAEEALETFRNFVATYPAKTYLLQIHQELIASQELVLAVGQATNPEEVSKLINAHLYYSPHQLLVLLETALQEWPNNTDLILRSAELLNMANQSQRALDFINKALELGDRGFRTVSALTEARQSLLTTEEITIIAHQLREDILTWKSHPLTKDLLLSQPSRLYDLLHLAGLHLFESEPHRPTIEYSYQEIKDYLTRAQESTTLEEIKEFTSRALIIDMWILQVLLMLEPAVITWPQDYELHSSLAQALLRTGQATVGLTIAQKLITLAPKNTEGYRQESLAFELLGHYENARESALKAVEINPDEWKNHYRLAASLEYFPHRIEEALNSGEKALNLSQGNPVCYLKLAGIMIHTDKWPKVKRLLSDALDANPDNDEIRRLLFYFSGKNYSSLNDLETKRQLFTPFRNISLVQAYTEYQTNYDSANDWSAAHLAEGILQAYIDAKQLPQ